MAPQLAMRVSLSVFTALFRGANHFIACAARRMKVS